MTVLGAVTRSYSVRFERTSKHPAARLWRAITDPGEVSAWMTYPARIDLRVGGDYFVDFTRTDGSELDGVIVKLEPERLLRYAWGTSVVEWEIEPADEGCRFTFAHYGLHDRGLPDEEGLLAGWHAWLDDFERFADGALPRSPAENDADWKRLCRLYRPVLSDVLGGLRSDSLDATAEPATGRA
jgi:uncharacterized protein YndB with AHSA1/START domain